MSQPTHSNLFGGSSAKRSIYCTGSVILKDQVPERPSSEPARMGTGLHKLMEMFFDPAEKQFDFEHVDTEGCKVRDERDGDIRIPAELFREKFWPAVEAVEHLLDLHEPGEYYTEQSLQHHTTSGPEVFGTVDLLFRSKAGYGVVCDYKFGFVDVDPYRNYQLAFYATGAMDNHMIVHPDDEIVKFVIVQPGIDGSVIKTWDCPMEWLRWYQRLETIAYEAIKSGNVDYNPGTWCQYCRAAMLCPAPDKALDQMLVRIGENEDVRLSPERMSLMLDEFDQIRIFEKMFREEADRMVKAGAAIPGRKLVRASSNRKWTSEKDALKAASKQIGDDAVSAKLKTPAQLEKAFHKNGEDFDSMVPFITRPEGKLTLVTLDTPGNAVVPQTAVDMPKLNTAQPRKIKRGKK